MTARSTYRMTAAAQWPADGLITPLSAIQPHLTEEQFQTQVIGLCKLLGLTWYHTHNSRRSVAGFPDLVIVGAPGQGVIYAELKTTKGRVSAPQQSWHDLLRDAGEEAHIWRPMDINEIALRLHAHAQPKEPG